MTRGHTLQLPNELQAGIDFLVQLSVWSDQGRGKSGIRSAAMPSLVAVTGILWGPYLPITIDDIFSTQFASHKHNCLYKFRWHEDLTRFMMFNKSRTALHSLTLGSFGNALKIDFKRLSGYRCRSIILLSILCPIDSFSFFNSDVIWPCGLAFIHVLYIIFYPRFQYGRPFTLLFECLLLICYYHHITILYTLHLSNKCFCF